MKLKFKFFRLMDEDNGYGGDGGGANGATAIFEDDNGGGEDLNQGVDPVGVQTTPTASSEPMLTAAQWAQIQGQLQSQQAQPQAQQTQPQLSEEEINEMLKVWNPSDATVEALFGDSTTPEMRLNALQEFRDGVVNHLLAVMGHANQILDSRYQQQFRPALEMVQDKEDGMFADHIVNTYPALKGQEQIVRQVITSFHNAGYNVTDLKQATIDVAGQVEKWLKAGNPQFSLSAQPQQNQQLNTNMPQMATQVGGAGGGAAGAANGGGRQKDPGWKGIFT